MTMLKRNFGRIATLSAVIAVLAVTLVATAVASHINAQSSECDPSGHTHDGVLIDCWSNLSYNSSSFWGSAYSTADENISSIKVWNQGWEWCIGQGPSAKWSTGWIEDTNDWLVSGRGSESIAYFCLPIGFIESVGMHHWSSSPHGHDSYHFIHHPNV